MEELKPKTFKIGEQIKLGDNSLTVNSCEVILPDKDIERPDDKYFAIEVTIENTGDRPLQYNSLDFVLRDQNCYVYSLITLVKKSPDLGFGVLPSLSTKRGWITFEIPNNANVEIIYQPFEWNEEQIIVKLK